MTRVNVYTLDPKKCKGVEQKVNVTEGFVPCAGVNVVISDSKGSYFVFPVYQRNNELFARKGNSYIRLRHDGRTGGNLRWLEFQVAENKEDWEYEFNTSGYLVLKS
jgi:hypothetical protein